MSHDQNAKRVRQYAIDQGYTLKPTGSGHWLAVHPCGATVTLSSSLQQNLAKKEIARLRNEKKRRLSP